MQWHRLGHTSPGRWTNILRRGELSAIIFLFAAAILGTGVRSIAAHNGGEGQGAGCAKSASAAPDAGSANDAVADSAAEVARIYAALEAYTADPVNPDRVILDGGIRQGLASLDPFSSFFDSDQFHQLQQQQRGQAVGFGSILYVQTGKILVISVAPDSPSGRAGLGPGDQIVEVNGTRIAPLDFQSMVELLQRSREKPVRLGVVHAGKVVAQDYELKPAEVDMPTVDKTFLLRPGIGYLHVASFESNTPQEVSQALAGLQRSAPNPVLHGVILDLRDNHGGQVQAAVTV